MDEFKQVIGVKAAEWLNDSSMNQYLRPSTLFAGKFDNYLNQKTKFKRQEADEQSKRVVEMAKARADEYLKTPVADSEMFF